MMIVQYLSCVEPLSSFSERLTQYFLHVRFLLNKQMERVCLDQEKDGPNWSKGIFTVEQTNYDYD